MGTRTENEEKLLDYNFLNKEVKQLKADKAKLALEIAAEEKVVSTLREKRIKSEEKNSELVKAAELKAKDILEEASLIVTGAKEKMAKATKKDAEVEAEKNNLKELQKQADNLIKSNQGKEKNLGREEKYVAELKEKLNKVLELIKEI